MRKLFFIYLSALIFVTVLIGCGQSDTAKNDKLSIVTTIFPEYDWVMNILGDNAENVDVTMLLDSGVDLHNFQPTADDIIKISTCDMFIYVGGHSDDWVEDALKQATNKDMVVVNLLEVLGDGAKLEDHIEGMQAPVFDEEEDEDDEEDHQHLDEHIWLSLRHAEVLCRCIANQLCEMDDAHKATYEANVSSYLEQLATLDAKYQEAVDAAEQDIILFGDRFPFRYMFDDYGLNYYAAFTGCSAETEASFETIAFLAGKVDELNLSAILQIESSDGSIPNTIKQTTAAKDQTILTMDSLQSTTASDVKNGLTYLSVMENNLEVLKEALK